MAVPIAIMDCRGSRKRPKRWTYEQSGVELRPDMLSDPIVDLSGATVPRL